MSLQRALLENAWMYPYKKCKIYIFWWYYNLLWTWSWQGFMLCSHCVPPFKRDHACVTGVNPWNSLLKYITGHPRQRSASFTCTPNCSRIAFNLLWECLIMRVRLILQDCSEVKAENLHLNCISVLSFQIHCGGVQRSWKVFLGRGTSGIPC